MDRNSSNNIHLKTDADFTENLTWSPILCPKGHMTHVFLACDVQSDCWAEGYGELDNADVPSYAACPAQLTSLPPSFVCTDGEQHVPYTLLCDHRPDCQDRSDEDFCVFPPCTGNSLLQCSTTEQVSTRRMVSDTHYKSSKAWQALIVSVSRFTCQKRHD